MKYHVHIYRVTKKWEIEIEANSEAEANKKALDRLTAQPWEAMSPDCRLIAMPFKVEKC
jgi:hypothetical protein